MENKKSILKSVVPVMTSLSGKAFSGKDLEDLNAVKSMLAGNKNAFTSIYKRYYATIRQKYMTSFKFNPDIVDDLTQDLFIKVSENIDKYSELYTFNSWISRVAKNHMLDYIRKSKMDTVSYDKENAGDDGELFSIQLADSNTLNGEDILIKRQRAEAMNTILEMLDEKTRRVVQKRYFDNLSYDEIAQEEGIIIGQVKILLFRAKAKMKISLTENKMLAAACEN